jgi:hypothetical protein
MWKKSLLRNLPLGLPVCSSLEWLESISEEVGSSIIFEQSDHYFPSSIKKSFFINILEGLGAEKRSSAGYISSGTNRKLPLFSLSDLQEKVDLIDLRRIPEAQVESFFPAVSSRHVSSDGAYYTLFLDGECKDYFASLKKKFRQNLRTSKNKLFNDFNAIDVEFRDQEVTTENWSHVLNLWREVDRNSWQGRKGLTAIHNVLKLSFLKKIVDSKINVRVFLFFVKKHPIAIRWFFSLGRDGLFYSVQFNSKFSQYRPGHLLTAEAIRYCFANGICNIDFGHGDSGHKKDWLARRNPLVRIIVPLSFFGRIRLRYQKLRWCIGQKIKK